MKKIKLIAPILGATAALAPVITLASCGVRTIQMYKFGGGWSTIDDTHLSKFNVSTNEKIKFNLADSSGNQDKTILISTGFDIDTKGKINNIEVEFVSDGSGNWGTTIPSAATGNISIEMTCLVGTTECLVTAVIGGK